MKSLIKYAALLMLDVFAVCACAQGFEEAPAKIDQTLYVSVGGRGNGRKHTPFGSIQEALTQAVYLKKEHGKNVKIIIADGIYREKVSLRDGGSERGFIVLQAEHTGKVILSGSGIVSDWVASRDIQWPKNITSVNCYTASLPLDLKQKLTEDPKGKVFADGKVPNQWPKYVKDTRGVFCN